MGNRLKLIKGGTFLLRWQGVSRTCCHSDDLEQLPQADSISRFRKGSDKSKDNGSINKQDREHARMLLLTPQYKSGGWLQPGARLLCSPWSAWPLGTVGGESRVRYYRCCDPFLCLIASLGHLIGDSFSQCPLPHLQLWVLQSLQQWASEKRQQPISVKATGKEGSKHVTPLPCPRGINALADKHSFTQPYICSYSTFTALTIRVNSLYGSLWQADAPSLFKSAFTLRILSSPASPELACIVLHRDQLIMQQPDESSALPLSGPHDSLASWEHMWHSKQRHQGDVRNFNYKHACQA